MLPELNLNEAKSVVNSWANVRDMIKMSQLNS